MDGIIEVCEGITSEFFIFMLMHDVKMTQLEGLLEKYCHMTIHYEPKINGITA